MSLQEDALQLAELDRQLIMTVVEGDTKAFESTFIEYQTLRKSLKTSLLDQPVVSVKDVNAAEVLRKIVGDVGLPSDRVIERLLSHSDETNNLEEFDDKEFDQIGSDIFYSWFSHYEYVRGLAELRPLIVRGNIPEAISQLIRQVKNCYAFQQYGAAYGLCRTVIEASIRDICVRRQLLPDVDNNMILFDEYRWSDLRDKVSSGALRERLRALYSDLCVLLHGRKTVTHDETRQVFEETLQVIEQLYATHEL